MLENATNTEVDMAIAYTVDADEDAKYKNKNFLAVVPERLQRKKYDTLVLQGGCNEVSNITISPNPSHEAVRSWEEKVRKSRTKMFELAENCLNNNQSLSN